MKKKNWFLVIIILIAALLIATVIWIYAKRIEHIESKMKISSISIHAKLLLYIWGDVRRKMIYSPLPDSSVASQADNHTTLIYFSPENNLIFTENLRYGKRYPTQFILYPVRKKVIDASTTPVINSNTKDRADFYLVRR